MALDSLMIGAISARLNKSLTGAVIEKIRQPDRDMLVFTVRTGEGMKNLLVSANTGTSRAHFTETARENPAQPPMFCMLLRKHLTGARIKSVSQPNRERMLELELSSRNELGDDCDLRLVIELMGKISNAILVSSEGRIIDCLRRFSYAGEEGRCLNPGMFYRYPPKQNKANFFTPCEQELQLLLSLKNPGEAYSDWLKAGFSGLSPAMTRELEFRFTCGLYKNQGEALSSFLRDTSPDNLVPLLYTKDGAGEFSAFPLKRLETAGWKLVKYESFSCLLEDFYAAKDALEHKNRIGHRLSHSVKTNRERLARKLAAQSGELVSPEELEILRRRAELVTANIYRIKKGDRAVVCHDYYSGEDAQISIELDPLKNPQQNSNYLYKQYSKRKTAASVLEKLMEEERKQLDYLDSVTDELSRAGTEQEISEIADELTRTGWLRSSGNDKRKKLKPSQPLELEAPSGKKVCVGRNNTQNDLLTHKLASRTDYWFHIKNYHGSHVILSCRDEKPSEQDILFAASLAVKYSQADGGGKQAVDYTMVRNVKKPSGAYPGNVIYTDYSTVLVNS